MHVPYIASWPGVIKPGSVSENLVDTTDVVPTLLEAAGAAAPQSVKLDGHSLMAEFRGESATARSAIYSWHPTREREFAADKSGAEYVQDPEALASALAKLHNGVQVRPMPEKAGTSATSSLYIVFPFRAKGGLSNLFSTHPPIEERIKRLRRMAGYVVE